MSGDNFDQALFDIMRTAQPGIPRNTAVAQRVNELYEEHGQEVGVWIVDGTGHAFNRHTEITEHRRRLVAALNAIEKATVDAFAALDDLNKSDDMALITPQRNGKGVRYVAIEQALYQVKTGTAAAQHCAPDPENVDL